MSKSIRFVVLSAERHFYTREQNSLRTDTLRAELQSAGLQFTEARGRYKGDDEASFAVSCPTDEAYAATLRLAAGYAQESILRVDEAGVATLIYLGDGSYRRVGRWREVTEERATAEEGYTYMGGRYYVAI